jgi:CHAT domain-containing protein/tetratricopeptide (TPR) repeat protein
MRCRLALRSITLVAFASLSLFPATPAQDTQAIRTLEPNQPIERELAGGQAHLYQLTLAAGHYLHLIVEQRGIDVVVTLFGTDNQKLIEMDSPNSTLGPEPLSYVAEQAGNYRVEVRSPDKGAAAGRYEIKIAELRAAAPQDKSRVMAARIFAAGEQLRGQGTAVSLRQALAKYDASLPHYRAAADRKGESIALNNIGFVYSSLGEKRKALDYYQQALPIMQEIGERAEEAAALHNIGKVYYDLDEKPQAIAYSNQALERWRAVGDSQGEARTLTSLGAYYFSLEEHQKSLQHYEQALQLRRAINDRRGEAITLLNIGATYRELGEYQQVINYNRQALTIARAINFRQGEAVTLHNLGSTYDNLGERQRALDHYQQALPIFRLVGDRDGEARTLNHMGLIHDYLGAKQQAIDYYQQALPVFRALGSRSGEALTLNNLGAVYHSLGEREKALNHHNQALGLRRTVGDRSGEAMSLLNLSRIYSDAGEPAKALEYGQQALALYRDTGNRHWEPVARYQIARLERERGNLAAAQAEITAALQLIESLRTNIAAQELRASYFATVNDYYGLGIDVLMRRHQQQPQAGFDAAAWQISERARARSLLETLTEANANIRQGIDPTLLERERALQRQLNSKEQARLQLLARKSTPAQIPAQIEAVDKEIRELTTQYEELQTRIKTSSPRYAALTQPQPLTLAEIQQQVLDDNTMLLQYALGEARSYLWAVSHDAVTSFELPKRADIEAAARGFYDALVAFNQPSRAMNTNAAAKTSATPNTTEAGAALSRMLLSPVAGHLGTKRLLIVADGTLQYLPFAALPDPVVGKKQNQPPTTSHQPLILDHEIISLPSASSLAALRRELAGRKPAAKALALFADPVFSADDARLQRAQAQTTAQPTTNETREFEPPLTRALREVGIAEAGLRIPRLPGTRREAAAITAFVPTAERKQALDFEASRAAVTSEELSQYRILHFATHGLLNSQHPELSGIVLSLVDQQGKPQDGFLRMHEIYNLKLPAELVVLSACQTGLGKDIKGEGLVGLTRGFMYAGAARVLASMWKVDDRATAELMKNFYQSMVKDGLRPAAALRAAQVAMWKQQRWQEPYYWAAFMLQGEWK